MGLIVRDAGSGITIQDLGRPGYRRFGVPAGGASDRASFLLANALLGQADAAALEISPPGVLLESEGSYALAIAGAPFQVGIESSNVGSRAIAVPSTFNIEAGERLRMRNGPRGLRCYLSVRGGWDSPIVMGSRSSESRIVRGSIEPVVSLSITASRRPALNGREVGYDDRPIRVLPGPDAGEISEAAEMLASESFRVLPESDRKGTRLSGPLPRTQPLPDRLSAPTIPGTVQYAGGVWIILGVAGGTMGGYPNVAQVISEELDRIGQARPGDLLRFRFVDLDEARRLLHTRIAEETAYLNRIRCASLDAFGRSACEPLIRDLG